MKKFLLALLSLAVNPLWGAGPVKVKTVYINAFHQYVHFQPTPGPTGGCPSGSYIDNFTRANGALGPPWNLVNPAGSITIVSNTAQPAAFNSADSVAVVTGCSGFTYAQYAEITATNTVSSNGVYGASIEGSDATHGYIMHCQNSAGGCYLFDFTGTFITFIGGTIGDGDKACITITGTTVAFWLNGTFAGSASVATLPQGAPGLYFGGQGASVAQTTSFKGGNGAVCP